MFFLVAKRFLVYIKTIMAYIALCHFQVETNENFYSYSKKLIFGKTRKMKNMKKEK